MFKFNALSRIAKGNTSTTRAPERTEGEAISTLGNSELGLVAGGNGGLRLDNPAPPQS
jgi:hypothetical protein